MKKITLLFAVIFMATQIAACSSPGKKAKGNGPGEFRTSPCASISNFMYASFDPHSQGQKTYEIACGKIVKLPNMRDL